jgi:predicted GIY-YIG superfamily endonuclease
MKPFWVYILRCRDGSYYTGHTDELERRLAQHDSGEIPGCYTFTRRPLKLVFSQSFATREEALAAERQIKGWSRKKKEAMMRGDWAEVSRLARSSTNQTALRQAQGERIKKEGSGRTDCMNGLAVCLPKPPRSR